MNFMKDVAKEIKGDKTSDNDQNWEIDPGLGEVFDSMLEQKSFDMKKKPNEIVKKIFANARIRGKKQQKKLYSYEKNKTLSHHGPHCCHDARRSGKGIRSIVHRERRF